MKKKALIALLLVLSLVLVAQVFTIAQANPPNMPPPTPSGPYFSESTSVPGQPICYWHCYIICNDYECWEVCEWVCPIEKQTIIIEGVVSRAE